MQKRSDRPSGLDFWDREFGTCEHGLGRAFCPSCGPVEHKRQVEENAAVAESDRLAGENDRLRVLLAAHGIRQ